MEMNIEIKMRNDCPQCRGQGVHLHMFEKHIEVCDNCEGRGWVFTELGLDMINTLCAVYNLRSILRQDQMTDRAKRLKKHKEKKE